MESLSLRWYSAYSPVKRGGSKMVAEAMQSQTVDVVKRMKEITQVMQTPQQVLEAHDIYWMSCRNMLNRSIWLMIFIPLEAWYLFLATSKTQMLKSADVASTIVENNPRSQESVIESNGLESLLLNFTSDTDMRSRTQALGAISSLIRNNQTGIAGFRIANGYTGLRYALESDSVRFQRKSLNLLHYLLQENDSDCDIAVQLGFHHLMMHLVSSIDADVRETALRGLLELAKARKECNTCGSSIEKGDEKLRQILEDRIKGISLMSQEDLSAAKEERQLLNSLWVTFYNEPSYL